MRDRPGTQRDAGEQPAHVLAQGWGRDLREILSRIYFSQRGIVNLLNNAGLSPAPYNIEGSAHLVWGELIEKANLRMELDQLLDAVEGDGDAKLWRLRIRELRRPSPLPEARFEGDIEPSDREHEERLMGPESTLLHVAFLARGAAMATGVVRLSVRWGREDACGTGFLITERRILTNHHVLFRRGAEPAERAQAWFNHELDARGLPVSPNASECDVATIFGDRAHDWAVIDLIAPPAGPCSVLSLRAPSVPVAPGDRVYIIQHPLGGYKQIGMHNNVTTRVSEDRIQYMTDTEPGSSGSPVFNKQWELVALHHCSTAVDRTSEGDRGSAPVAGTGRNERDFRNQGVRIERVIEGLKRLRTGG